MQPQRSHGPPDLDPDPEFSASRAVAAITCGTAAFWAPIPRIQSCGCYYACVASESATFRPLVCAY